MGRVRGGRAIRARRVRSACICGYERRCSCVRSSRGTVGPGVVGHRNPQHGYRAADVGDPVLPRHFELSDGRAAVEPDAYLAGGVTPASSRFPLGPDRCRGGTPIPGDSCRSHAVSSRRVWPSTSLSDAVAFARPRPTEHATPVCRAAMTVWWSVWLLMLTVGDGLRCAVRRSRLASRRKPSARQQARPELAGGRRHPSQRHLATVTLTTAFGPRKSGRKAGMRGYRDVGAAARFQPRCEEDDTHASTLRLA